MKKILGIYIMVILLLVGCSTNEQQNSIVNEQNASNEQENEELKVIAEDLNVPWSIEKHDNTFYLTQRPGSIVKIVSERIPPILSTVAIKKPFFLR